MSQRSSRRLNPLNTTPNFKLQISQFFLNPPNCILFQQDSTIIVLRQDRYVEVYVCDQYYSCIENYFQVKDVNSLINLKVKYDRATSQLTLIYRSKNQIVFERRTNRQSNPRSRISSDSASRQQSVLFCQESPIIDISEIIQCSRTQIYCFITVSSGKTYLLSLVNNKLSIHNVKPLNRAIGFFKGIINTFVSSNFKNYQKCNSHCQLLRNSQFSTSMYLTSVLNQQIHVKYFHELNSTSTLTQQWEISNIENPIPPNTFIINSLFIPQNLNELSIFMLCHLDKTKIVLYILTIGKDSKMKNIKMLDNIFNLQQVQQQEMQDQSESQQIDISNFNQEFDQIDMQYFKNKVYLLYNKRIWVNNHNIQRHYIVDVSKVQQQWEYTRPILLNIEGCLRMIKITENPYNRGNQMERGSEKLLLIGQSICQSIEEEIQQPQEDSNNLQKLLQKSSGSKRPPQPQIIEMEEEQKKSQQKKQQKMQQQKMQYNTILQNTQFTPNKIDNYIKKKEWVKLFTLLQKQKQKLSDNKQEQMDILHASVLHKLFTKKKKEKYQMQIQLILSFFNNIQIRCNQNNQDFSKFLKQLFIDKQPMRLRLVFQQLIRQKKMQPLCKVCTETIPQFIYKLEKLNSKKGVDAKGAQNLNDAKGAIDEQGVQDKEQQCSFQLDLPGFSELYLSLYEQLIQVYKPNPKNKRSSSMSGEDQTQNYYNQKQLLQNYCDLISKTSVKTAVEISQQKLLKMAETYLQNSSYFNQLFILIATKHRLVTLFDQLIRKRIAKRKDVQNFVNQKLSEKDRNHITRILINMVNTEIQFVKNSPSMKNNLGLYMLESIPQEYSHDIYEALRDRYPKIAIIFALKNKPRKEIAQDLENRTSVFDIQFQSPSQVLTTLCPLYSVGGKHIKANVDLAKLIEERTFTSFNKLIEGDKKFNVSKNRWASFENKAKNYLTEDELNKIQNKIIINQ